MHTKFNIYVFISRPCILLLFHLFLVVSNFIDKLTVSLLFEFMILILTHNFSCCIVVSWYTNFCGFMLPTKTHENLLTLQVYHGWRGLLFDINSDCCRISHITGNGFIKTYVVNRKSAIKDWKVLLNILKSDWSLKKKCCERLKWVVKRLNKIVVKDWKKVLCKID